MFYRFHVRHKQRGFSIIEILVALGIFSLFATGIYTGIQFAFKVVQNSRISIMESGIAGREIEFIRNLPYGSVGITDGVPIGILERSSTTTEGEINFVVRRTVRNVDDPFDGLSGGNPNDAYPEDYKFVQIEVVCGACSQTSPVVMVTNVAQK